MYVCRLDVSVERDGSSSSGSYSEDSVNDEGFQSASLPSSQELLSTFDVERQSKGSKKGRRRSKEEPPQTHVHLGGVRHCRIPLAPEIREVCTYVYTFNIMDIRI